MYDVVLTSEQAKAAGTAPGTRNTRASTKAERLQGPYDTAVNDERINGIVGRPGKLQLYKSSLLLSFSPSISQPTVVTSPSMAGGQKRIGKVHVPQTVCLIM